MKLNRRIENAASDFLRRSFLQARKRLEYDAERGASDARLPLHSAWTQADREQAERKRDRALAELARMDRVRAREFARQIGATLPQ